MNFKEYYSRKEVVREFVRTAKDREVQAWFNDVPGKRPDVIHFDGDVIDYIKQGMTSLHLSTERWRNPLILKSGMTKKELDDQRKGWDFIIDIDCKAVEYSKIAAFYILDLLKFYNIKGVFLKFSGSTGFHIGVGFESFPSEINNVDVRKIFPEGLHVFASYMKDRIKDYLSKDLLRLDSVDVIASKIGKSKNSLFVKEGFDPFSVVNIDTVLISSRHMFRAPYSLNEKKWLVSLPIKLNGIHDFSLDDARAENVKVKLKFLDEGGCAKGEAKSFMVDAFDWQMKTKKDVKNVVYEMPKNAIKIESFPPCINLLLNGVKTDGRKRGLFILVNFLRNTGYDIDVVEKMINDWNKLNYEALKDGYVKSQVLWFKRQSRLILPPNCDNLSYYKAIGVCKPDNFCRLIKNPVNYAVRKSRIEKKVKVKR